MTGMERLKAQLTAAVRAEVLGRSGRPPEAGEFVWKVFAQLSAVRTMHYRGANRIAYAEIEAWSRLYRTPLEPHHVDLIRAMDDAWIAAIDEAFDDEAGLGRAAPRPAGEISPELFDAVFG